MKLQNNYTTPEQNKRLLEFGVPIDTADCYYTFHGDNIAVLPEGISYSKFCKSIEKVLGERLFPCWSVGRLMEILKKCIERDDDKEVIFMELTYKQGPIVNLLMDVFEDRPVMDFSKLEN